MKQKIEFTLKSAMLPRCAAGIAVAMCLGQPSLAQFSNNQIPDLTPFQLLDVAAANQERLPEDENILAFQTQVLDKPGVVLIEFMIPTCAECAPTVKTLKEVVTKYDGKVDYLRLDINKNPGLGIKYDVPRVPAVLVFKDGQLQEKLAVFNPRQKPQLIFALDDALELPHGMAPAIAGRVTSPTK